MPRKKFYPSDNLPYHVTGRSHNKEFFNLPLNQMWQLFENNLARCEEDYNLKIHSFVLMNNHYHMLASTPDANLNESMNYLLREVSKDSNFLLSRTNQTFGGPYKWAVISNGNYYSHAYKYVYRNPVKAGLCKKVEDYPYSTIQNLIGRKRFKFHIHDNFNFITDPFNTLNWLNQDFEDPTLWSRLKSSLKYSDPENRLNK